MIKEIKITPKLLKQLHMFWPKIRLIEELYWKELNKAEKELEELTGINGIEIFHSDNSIIGIGNAERTLRLIHSYEIERNKIDKKLND